MPPAASTSNAPLAAAAPAGREHVAPGSVPVVAAGDDPGHVIGNAGDGGAGGCGVLRVDSDEKTESGDESVAVIDGDGEGVGLVGRGGGVGGGSVAGGVGGGVGEGAVGVDDQVAALGGVALSR